MAVEMINDDLRIILLANQVLMYAIRFHLVETGTKVN
jgi:hypothetical protein